MIKSRPQSSPKYLELIRAFLLRPIRSETGLDRARSVASSVTGCTQSFRLSARLSGGFLNPLSRHKLRGCALPILFAAHSSRQFPRASARGLIEASANESAATKPPRFRERLSLCVFGRVVFDVVHHGGRKLFEVTERFVPNLVYGLQIDFPVFVNNQVPE